MVPSLDAESAQPPDQPAEPDQPADQAQQRIRRRLEVPGADAVHGFSQRCTAGALEVRIAHVCIPAERAAVHLSRVDAGAWSAADPGPRALPSLVARPRGAAALAATGCLR